MRVEVKRDLCIGAATCVTVAPKTFVMDDEMKAIVKAELGDDADIIMEAARVCPTLAIYIYDDQDQQIFPPKDKLLDGHSQDS